MGKLNGTSLTGPLRLTRQNGTTQREMGRSASVTVSALAAEASEELTISDSDILAGDVIIWNFAEAPEAAMSVDCHYCKQDGEFSIRVRNLDDTDPLAGGNLDVNYQILR